MIRLLAAGKGKVGQLAPAPPAHMLAWPTGGGITGDERQPDGTMKRQPLVAVDSAPRVISSFADLPVIPAHSASSRPDRGGDRFAGFLLAAGELPQPAQQPHI